MNNQSSIAVNEDTSTPSASGDETAYSLSKELLMFGEPVCEDVEPIVFQEPARRSARCIEGVPESFDGRYYTIFHLLEIVNCLFRHSDRNGGNPLRIESWHELVTSDHVSNHLDELFDTTQSIDSLVATFSLDWCKLQHCANQYCMVPGARENEEYRINRRQMIVSDMMACRICRYESHQVMGQSFLYRLVAMESAVKTILKVMGTRQLIQFEDY